MTHCGFVQVLRFGITYSYTQMHTYTEIHTAHTGNNRLTPLYKFILTAPAMCSYHLCTLH